MLPEIARPEGATTVAGKIIEAIAGPILLEGHGVVTTSTTIGTPRLGRLEVLDQ